MGGGNMVWRFNCYNKDQNTKYMYWRLKFWALSYKLPHPLKWLELETKSVDFLIIYRSFNFKHLNRMFKINDKTAYEIVIQNK